MGKRCDYDCIRCRAAEAGLAGRGLSPQEFMRINPPVSFGDPQTQPPAEVLDLQARADLLHAALQEADRRWEQAILDGMRARREGTVHTTDGRLELQDGAADKVKLADGAQRAAREEREEIGEMLAQARVVHAEAVVRWMAGLRTERDVRLTAEADAAAEAARVAAATSRRTLLDRLLSR